MTCMLIRKTHLDVVFDVVKEETGYSRSDLLAPTKGNDKINEARYLAIALVKLGYRKSFNATGRVFKRDSKSIQYAIGKVRSDAALLKKAIEMQVQVLERV